MWGYGLRIGGDGEDGNMDGDAMGEGRKSWQHGSGRFSTLEVSKKAGKACWCLVMNTFSLPCPIPFVPAHSLIRLH